MKKYVPIVTDDPQDNVEAALNLVFIKDEEVYVRGYGPAPDFSDATLSNVTRDILQKYSPETLENVRLKDDLELSCATSEWLFDGIDTIEGVVALLYTMAWAFAETRERLRMYEETRLSPMDLKDRLIAPFQNDMFAMVWGAFKKLYPDKECEIYWEPQIRDEEDGKPVYGLTDFADDGSVAVFVKPSLEVADAVEVLRTNSPMWRSALSTTTTRSGRRRSTRFSRSTIASEARCSPTGRTVRWTTPMKSELRFSWPDTGELSVRINGNESAALRFFPSEEAIIDGLRKNGVEAAYGDFADAHPHTHGNETDTLLTVSGDS